MSLESREDYERLNEHLAEIDAPLEAFARSRDYTLTPRLRGGLYPRVSLTQTCSVIRSIQITMDFDRHDERFDHFFPEIPYTIFGTAWIDDFTVLTRWHCPNIRIEGVPFCVLVQTLELHLDHFHCYLSGITGEYIRACARTSQLSQPPPDIEPQ
jgi:hypothetical protein